MEENKESLDANVQEVIKKIAEEVVKKDNEKTLKISNNGYRRAIPITFEFDHNDIPLGYAELFDESRIKDVNWEDYGCAIGATKNSDGTWTLLEISIVKKENAANQHTGVISK